MVRWEQWIQQHNWNEADYRGEQYKELALADVKGNNDLIGDLLTWFIKNIHRDILRQVLILLN